MRRGPYLKAHEGAPVNRSYADMLLCLYCSSHAPVGGPPRKIPVTPKVKCILFYFNRLWLCVLYAFTMESFVHSLRKLGFLGKMTRVLLSFVLIIDKLWHL